MLIAETVEDDNISTSGSESNKPAENVVAPWVGYNEEETIKAQILALSQVVDLSFYVLRRHYFTKIVFSCDDW